MVNIVIMKLNMDILVLEPLVIAMKLEIASINISDITKKINKPGIYYENCYKIP
jgi:hypothetical protein